MILAITFGAYERRRFSRPWIAKIVAWQFAERPTLDWGRCIEDSPGSGGRLEITATPGDIVRYGMRDYEGLQTSNEWALVQPGGTLKPITVAEARQLWVPRTTTPHRGNHRAAFV